MKMNMAKAWIIRMAILVAVACLTGIAVTTSDAQVAGAPGAVVEAVQGDATVTTGTEQEPQRLATGSTVNAWNMVNTNGGSKLFLQWGTGLLNSLGEFSSMFLVSTETPSGPMDALQMTEGALRVTKESGGGPASPYVVTTPSASVEPVNYQEPLDFIVEVFTPQTSVVTVISGRVKVKNTTLSQPTETLVEPCQSVYVEEGKPDLDVVLSTPADLNRLVANTTIPQTITASFQCPVPPGPPSIAQPPVAVPQYVQYEYEDWESYDIYPYNEITILPPEPGIGCVVILPGIGRWVIPIDVFVGWRFDPAVIGVYCRHIILDHMIYRDHYYLADVRNRQHQLRNLVYLSQLSGNRGMLLDAQRQLADLNVQSRWSAMRLNRLDNKLSALNQEQRKFAGKLPHGKNMFQAISNSFNSPKNLAVAQNFRDRVKTELNVQGQLAGMAGKELTDLRSKIAREKNPQARLALTDEFRKISKNVNQGKLPIPAKQAQVKQVLERFKQEQDPRKLQNIQKELTQLTKVEAPRTSELLNQKNLATLKQDVAKFPNPKMRSNLEAQVGQLQQSVEATKTAEINREKIDNITAQAAQEPNVQKRNELLGQIKELAKPAAGAAGVVGGLNLLEKRQVLESQLSLEQDKQKRSALEKALEDQRKHQAESLRQQLDRGKQAEMLQQKQEDIKKQAEPKLLEQERLKQTDQTRQQELERQKLLQQQGLQKQQELQKQQSEQKRLEEERLKQTDRGRQQQLEQQKPLQQQELQKQKQEELRKQTDQKGHLEQVEKQQLEQKKLQMQQDKQKQLGEQKLQQQQQEEQRRQQGEAERLKLKKLEQQRLEQTDQKRLQEQAEQGRRKQLEAETLRKQQEKSLQLQKQQEQGLQQRRQQEQSEQIHRQQQQQQQKQLQQQQQQQLQQQQKQLQQQQQKQLQQQQLQQQQKQLQQQQVQQQQKQLQQQQVQQQQKQLQQQQLQQQQQRMLQQQQQQQQQQQVQQQQMRQQQMRQQQEEQLKGKMQPPGPPIR